MADQTKSERVVERRVLHHGAKFSYESVRIVGPDGHESWRQMVRHPGAVVVVPVLSDGRLALIRNERFAVGQALLELPAGTLEPGEKPEICAGRELIEETGYEAATLTPLGRFYTTPGMTDELIWAYVGRGLRHVGQRLEPGEHITVIPTPMDAAMAMIDDGRLMDAKSMLALLLAHRRGLLDTESSGDRS